MQRDQNPHPDAGDDRDNDRQPQIVVDDPEDFAKTRQLRAIFDARDEYVQARRKANQMYEDSEITFPRKNKHIFRYLQDFAMAMEPLLKQYDAGTEIWEENEYSVDDAFTAAGNVPSFVEAIEFCEQIIESADEIKQHAVQTGYTDLADSTFDDEIAQAHQLLDKLPDEGEEYDGSHPAFKCTTFGGINDAPTADDVRPKIKGAFREFATPWGWSTKGLKSLVRRTPKLMISVQQINKFKSTAPPQHVADKAFSDLNDFIAEIGLGVTFETEQQTKIDDDLLEEVDQWRQNNT